MRAFVVLDVDGPCDHELCPPAGDPFTPEDMSKIAAAMRSATREWKSWVYVRDSMDPNHPMRYCDDMIRYHYAHDMDALDSSISIAEREAAACDQL